MFHPDVAFVLAGDEGRLPAWKGGEGKGKLISAYPVNCCGSVVR